MIPGSTLDVSANGADIVSTLEQGQIADSISNFGIETSAGLLGFGNDIVFEYNGLTGTFAAIHFICGAVALTILIINIIMKGIQSTVNISTGGDYIPPVQLIWDAIKGSSMPVILPWIFSAVLAILPGLYGLLFADFVFSFPVNETGTIENVISFANPGKWFFCILMFALIGLGGFCFTIKMCKFQVEMMILDAISIIAAVDSVSNKREIYENWLSTFKALIITMFANVAFYVLMQQSYYNVYASQSFGMMSVDTVLAIGAAACLIKGTIFTNKYKNGGFMGSTVSMATNAARTATTFIPKK